MANKTMQYRILGETGLQVSVIGLGTWVMGGWLWGGAEDRESSAAIREALDLGINLIDTAPIYGHGRAEALVGHALDEAGCRDRVCIATKVGLEWDSEKTKVWRNSSPSRIQYEVEESLRRLRTDYIDLYQVHWPDTTCNFGNMMEALLELQQIGKIKFIGVSNFDVPQMERCLTVGPIHTAQPPYNLFERGIERDVLPFCVKRNIGTLIYGPLCRGLLSGKYQGDEVFKSGDMRDLDPKFRPPKFQEYLACVDSLKEIALEMGKTVGQMAIRWCLDQPGVTVALCGARRPEQIRESVGAAGWSFSQSQLKQIDQSVSQRISIPTGPEFMAPTS